MSHNFVKSFLIILSFFAKITHQTIPVTLMLSGNHSETISFKIVSSVSTPLILGLPWLSLHNPQIDWQRQKIHSWSNHCQSVCLGSAVPLSQRPPVTPVKPSDLSSVPEEYLDIAEVFTKEKALSLPPYDDMCDRAAARGSLSI